MTEKARKPVALLWLPYTWLKTDLKFGSFLIRKNPSARFGDHQHAWGLRQLSSRLGDGGAVSATDKHAPFANAIGDVELTLMPMRIQVSADYGTRI